MFKPFKPFQPPSPFGVAQGMLSFPRVAGEDEEGGLNEA
jgi:hypothetical protein